MEREFHIYFGGWSGRQRSRYVVIFDARQPLLEVPLYNPNVRRDCTKRGFVITHNLSFAGTQKHKAIHLHQKALMLAKKAGLRVSNDKVELGILPATAHLSNSHVKTFLRAVVANAYVRANVKPSSLFNRSLAGGLKVNPFKPKTLSGQKSGTIVIKRKLEKQYGSLKRHERLIRCLAGKLRGGDFSPLQIRCPSVDVDLAAKRKTGKNGIVFEVKAWKSRYHVHAARHAYGQLEWYLWQLHKRVGNGVYKGCIVLDQKPSTDVVDFVESKKHMLAVWFIGLTIDGGKRARQEIPQLF